MRTFAILFLALSWFSHNAETVNFDGAKPGLPPQGWSFAITHKGDPGRWMVHPDATAPTKPNVLAQLAPDKNRGRYALALFDNAYCRDGEVSVNLKLVSGKNDQIGGVLWRYQDPNNFYALFVSGIEDKITVRKMINGKPTIISQGVGSSQISGVSRKIEPDEWNLLKVQFHDQRAVVIFNHRKLFEVEDDAILKPGKTGIWTKSDTVAYFDEFRVDKKKE